MISSAVTVLFVLALGTAAPRSGWTDDAQEAREIARRAKATVESFASDQSIEGSWRELMRQARGVLILPNVVRAGFIFGGSGGTGTLLARVPDSEVWAGPAFYTMGEASFGFQAGVDASEVVIIVRTERGLTRLLSSSAKLGADLSVAAGPVGGGAGTTLTTDLIVYSRSKGLYGGLSAEGTVLAVRDGLNHAYYGKPVTPADILIRRVLASSPSDGLVATVAKLAGGR